jgi:hypothetical protein
MERHFHEEYIRFFHALLRTPAYRPCAITDAMQVLLDPRSGVIRAAFEEDRAHWGRRGSPDADLAFMQAWAPGSNRSGVQGAHLNPLGLFLNPWASSYAPLYRLYGVF